MDEAKPIGQVLTTTTLRECGYSERTCAQGEAQQAKDDAILALLAELALHYWRPDFTPAQAKHLYADFITDLRDFAVKDIQHAVQAYRRNPESKFFPHPGALRGIMETPPAWYALGRYAWLRDCKEESRLELEKKEASLLRLASRETDRKGITVSPA